MEKITSRKNPFIAQLRALAADLSAEELVCSYLSDYDIPVCCGFPAGHEAENLPLLIGARSTLAVTDAGATLTFHVRGRRTRA